ncbi:hypothetical protein ZWY2020_006679 [Hordeum vulgare]|nr:hypothetical protein ZWY2020_006679 [Hordeum vulgare]
MIRLCTSPKDVLLSQPNLLELEAPIKVCGKGARFLPLGTSRRSSAGSRRRRRRARWRLPRLPPVERPSRWLRPMMRTWILLNIMRTCSRPLTH